MTSTTEEARRDSIVARLRAARADLERCVADVSPGAGMRGSEWSVLDLLGHLNDAYYQDMARRFLTSERPQLDEYDEEADWRRGVEQARMQVEDALGIATSLTSEQMGRVAQRDGRPFTALDALELCVAHVEEHLAQLRDEIRPREGLPSV